MGAGIGGLVWYAEQEKEILMTTTTMSTMMTTGQTTTTTGPMIAKDVLVLKTIFENQILKPEPSMVISFNGKLGVRKRRL